MAHQDTFRQALSMPLSKRATLAQALLQSLDDAEAEMSEDAVEREWAQLADQRWQAVENGTTQTVPANQVMQALRERFS